MRNGADDGDASKIAPAPVAPLKGARPLRQASRVLLVADRPGLRSRLDVMLAPEGIEVVHATDGERALEILRRHPPVDVVVSEVITGRMDGLRLVMELRKDSALAGTPVILLAGIHADFLHGLAQDLGADLCLVGSPTPAHVKVALRIAMSKAHRTVPTNPVQEHALERRYDDGMRQLLVATARDLDATREQLEERTESLSTMSAMLEERERGFSTAMMEIRRLNAGLEARSRELSALNLELESFAYSVSHDLRAPLRSLDGFSQALLEDYGSVLDEAGHDYLQRVRAAAQRMAALVDALLSLSRTTRAEVNAQDVDVSAMARAVAADLRKSAPDRDTTVLIEDGLTAHADPNLLRAVLENLLGNAWKFTSKTAGARIELGASDENGHRAFYVRDNGAGFDPAFGAKLFKPFQRLHPPGEFEGTGIGLVTVQRIVSRHGGTVRAEGKPAQGATFFFTLPVAKAGTASKAAADSGEALRA